MSPTVSIIIPCYNEEKSIRILLDAIFAQTYSISAMEVIIADGISEDNTQAEIAAFQDLHPDLDLRVIENPACIIPAALNIAVEAARGEIIVRLDAHSAPAPDYVERCVDALNAGLGDNVGGVWDIRPGTKGWVAASIAAAAAHPLGVGDALYRHATQAQIVDTVPFGAFRRELIEKIGLFDESLLANEDYEFNARIRESDGKIWLDPAIRSVYFARPTYSRLAKQYFNYGYWKWKMLRRYPETLRWRQALPPAFFLSIIFFLLLGFFSPLFVFLLILELLLYFFILFLAALKNKMLGLPIAIATMHISWGGGLLWSALTSVFKVKNG
ncbi:MAG: glycosyltransferase family 2 protein [Anaerolineae bacterium]|jgi:glycosyltransferase involved in cell wall biosynthesis|nr:glycosyltransferase family 2 protein [Anaerolineae bacterium]MBT4309363.1 glycosyltransferase family 2 protein [Anaerolineae bacterium]MBT4458114.1 glycosyltransferase family 2 protein [Anaerolineae bacterium]MBT4842547.1 glycosyltransferase family 2 protein [Anaerolineae bacterium]MBT6321934.1 glycosyltransferase family 2 protein [Anaerolineae bacterium]